MTRSSSRSRFGLLLLAVLAMAPACVRPRAVADAPGTAPLPDAPFFPPPLPDARGLGVPVLALHHDPAGALWAGTNGHGVWRLEAGAASWVRVDGGGRAPVTAVASDGAEAWYGTAGAGVVRLRRTTEGWTRAGAWTPPGGGAYVALNGVRLVDGTVHVATSAGLRQSGDGGETWRCAGVPDAASAGCVERVTGPANPYLLALEVVPAGSVWAGRLEPTLWAGHLDGLSVSRDGGRTWTEVGERQGLPRGRVRALSHMRGVLWLAYETQLFRGDVGTGRFQPAPPVLVGTVEGGWLPGGPRALVANPAGGWPAIATGRGLLAPGVIHSAQYRAYGGGDVWAAFWWREPFSPFAARGVGLESYMSRHPIREPAARPGCDGTPERRPDGSRVLSCENPVGSFRAEPPRAPWLRRPVESGNPYEALESLESGTALLFPNPAGTPVLAVADGVLAADPAGGVRLRTADGLEVRYAGVDPEPGAGPAVSAGDVIARVSAGGPDAPGLRLSVHGTAAGAAAPLNPALLLEPYPGTGVVAGRIPQADGAPARSAVVRGFHRDYPSERPLHRLRSYGAEPAPHPAYGENIVISGLSSGGYLLSAEVEGRLLWARAEVRAGAVTVVEFR
jgi:hypothetical protein